MKIIEPSVQLLNPPDYQAMLSHIETAARTCYQSDPKGDPEEFIQKLIKHGHLSTLEHSVISARLICDRGVMAELTRQRHNSFSVESSRYCNYASGRFGNEISFIRPTQIMELSTLDAVWTGSCIDSESAYFDMIGHGASPQTARSVLNHSLKTDIVTTANTRQWRLVFELRVDEAAHPDMRRSMTPLLGLMIDRYPAFFKDLEQLYSRSVCIFKDSGWQLAEVR